MAAVGLAASAAPARAVDVADGLFALNGYASLSYLRTNGNAYGAATQAGAYDNVDMALVVNSRPSERIHAERSRG